MAADVIYLPEPPNRDAQSTMRAQLLVRHLAGEITIDELTELGRMLDLFKDTP